MGRVHGRSREAETLSLDFVRGVVLGRGKMRAWEVCFKAADAETDWCVSY